MAGQVWSEHGWSSVWMENSCLLLNITSKVAQYILKFFYWQEILVPIVNNVQAETSDRERDCNSTV